MFETLKRHVREFVGRRSGTRFQTRFRNRSPERNRWHMIFTITLAVTLIPIGLVMLILPGPGMALLIVAALLIAGESLLAARALDRVDLALTRLWTRLRR
ncbi:MAG: hypothetical protein WBP11_08990 [Dokdonella sp.]